MTYQSGVGRLVSAGAVALALLHTPAAAQVVPATSGPRSASKPVDGPPIPVAPEVIARDERGRATVRANRVSQPLQLDGVLDEEVYQSVRAFSGLIQNQPDTGKPSSQKTDMWVFFDASHFYVSARCWDTAPQTEWIANEMRRDSNGIINNDTFGILVDTFYDRRNGYMFYTNFLGALRDVEITNEGNSNIDWNPVWDVRTARFDGGWSLEMRIPFRSLRYGSGTSQVWGLQVRRGIRRRGEWAFLTPVPATEAQSALNRASLAATLVGLEAPPRGKNLEVKPYAIGGLRTDASAVPAVSNELDGDLGFDVKYSPWQNLTLDLTYNTDFAQVETDEQQINLTRFNLFFPEKRDFFLEGRGLFLFARGNATRGMVGVGGIVPELFFSRQIGLDAGRVIPIVGGGRMTSKVGGTAFGALTIETDDGNTPTNFSVLRVKRDILRRSSIGAMFTGRSQSLRAPGRSNQAYGTDLALSFGELNLNGYAARTETPGLGGGEDSYQARLDYNADRYGLEMDHVLVGKNFNPEVGFVQRSDMRRTFAAARFSPRFTSDRAVRQFVLEGSIEYILNTASVLESSRNAVDFSTELQTSDRFSFQAARSLELLERPFRVAGGPIVPVGRYTFNAVRTSYSFGPQRKVAGALSFSHGGFYDGTQTTIALNSGRVELTSQFSVEPSVALNWFNLPSGRHETRLIRSRVTYTFTPRMFVSTLLQYNSTINAYSNNLRWRWEYTPGSELFVVYTDEHNLDTIGPLSGLLNRGLVVKFNRLFRF